MSNIRTKFGLMQFELIIFLYFGVVLPVKQAKF